MRRHLEEGPEFEDGYTQNAKRELRALFEENRERVFYSRQLQVLLERSYYHWITVRAMRELVEEGAVVRESLELRPRVPMSIFRHPRLRYWKRQASKVRELVSRFTNLGKAVGDHGELLVTAAFAESGFTCRGFDVREWAGRRWLETEHDLDRVFERDGIQYGVEIKNTLDYMDAGEFETKIKIAQHLGLVPLFVVRWEPKSRIYEVAEGYGGGIILFEMQMYPYGYDEFVEEVRERLWLPVASPKRLEMGVMRRVENVHERVRRHVNREGNSRG